MKVLGLFCWFLSCASLLAGPVRYILDTDIASDCDDAGAVAMANVLADKGEIEILAMMVSTGGPWGAPALCAINTWYGRGDIPIGTLKDPAFWVGGGKDEPASAANFESYNRVLAETFPTRIKSGEEAPEARLLYRKILAAQPDKSVVINTIGPLGNLALLMQTSADETSALDGMALIKAKVKLLVITGGKNPAGTSSNFSKGNAEKCTKPVIDGWPTPVVFVGNEISGPAKTGWGLNAAANEGNPAKEAYKRFHAGDVLKKRSSWDHGGVLFSARGLGDLFTVEEGGHMECDEKGNTKWNPEKQSGLEHAYLKKREGVSDKLEELLEILMNQGKKG